MKIIIRLVYNPGAGSGDENAQEEIVSLIELNGYTCEYSSSKKKVLKAIQPETSLIALAGGDGTIRKTILKLLNKKIKFKRPIGILPCGTANNIANSLGIPQDIAQNVASWKEGMLKNFDVGQVIGLPKINYFLESFGFGLFPKLMAVLKNKKTDHIQTADEEFKMALDELIKLTREYKAVSLRIEVNDEVIEQDCILVELMNISSLGPRLTLSEKADPSDGFFDLVIVSAAQRTLLEDYLIQIRDKGEAVFPIKAKRVQSLSIRWLGTDVHVDDEIVKDYNQMPLKVSMLNSLIEMIIPKDAV